MKPITITLCGIISFLFTLNLNAQTCISAIPETTPTTDFITHGDGTVTHNKTNLIWKVCAEGQSWDAGTCTGTPSTYTWDKALQNPQTLNMSGGYASYTDWRLPNRKELSSLIDWKCYNPVINEAIFPNMIIETAMPYTIRPMFWSSSPIDSAGSGLTFRASISFASGNGDSTSTDSNQVRLVRNAP